jgi:hypothetical protein
VNPGSAELTLIAVSFNSCTGNTVKAFWPLRRIVIRIPLLLLCLFVLSAFIQQSAVMFDLVLTGRRVMDLESGLDEVRNIGINGGRIAAVSAGQLRGRQVISVSGQLVAPGFIDLHSHGQTDENYRYKAMDGVTSALEMEVGVYLAGEHGLAGVTPGAPAAFIAIGHLYFDSAEAFQTAFSPQAEEIMSDIPNSGRQQSGAHGHREDFRLGVNYAVFCFH